MGIFMRSIGNLNSDSKDKATLYNLEIDTFIDKGPGKIIAEPYTETLLKERWLSDKSNLEASDYLPAKN